MDPTVAPLASIGVDIGKEVFHLVGFGTDGKIAFRRKIKRLALIGTFSKLPRCIVGMEACRHHQDILVPVISPSSRVPAAPILRVRSSVDCNYAAGDHACSRARKEHDHIGNFAGLREAPK